MTRRLTRTLLCAIAITLAAPASFTPAQTATPAAIGVLVLAHGGSRRWNRQVQDLVKRARLPYPTEVAFGMGMHPAEVQAVQRAVHVLEGRGVTRIVAIPLLISSHSEVMRQYEYLLGLQPDGPWKEHARPVPVHVPVTMVGALDDAEAVADVLLERAKALSRMPAEETVIVVAHGPNAEEDNAKWLQTMTSLASRVRERGGFRAVVPVTMRDDAPEPVLSQATEAMRRVVAEQSRTGRVLVVPLLLAQGGIERKIPKRLAGLPYALQAATLLPHPQLAQWLKQQVELAQVGSAEDQGAPAGRPCPCKTAALQREGETGR